MYMDTHNKLLLVCQGMERSKHKHFEEGGLPAAPQKPALRDCCVDLEAVGFVIWLQQG